MNNQPSTNPNDSGATIDASDSQNVPINTPSSQTAEPVFEAENPPTVPQNPTPAQPAPAATPTPTPTETPPTPTPAATPVVNQPPVKNVPQEPDTPESSTEVPIVQGEPQPEQAHIDAEEYGLKPPQKQPKPHSAVALIIIIAILFLGLGFSGGFYGYKYIPKFKNMIGATADTAVTTPTTSTTDVTADAATWKTYTNTKYKYSIDYPDTWFSDGLIDKEIKTIQFTSYKQDTGSTSTDGYKVEITFQDSNGKTLKDWVDANNTVAGETATPTKTTVGTKEAYQEEISGVTKSISTYILRDNLVMIVSYYASDAKFTPGKAFYDKMLESISFS